MDRLAEWRLCEELDIVQAALLTAGHDPAGAEMHVETMDPALRPHGYDAAKQAISLALCRGEIVGSWIRKLQYDLNGDYVGVDEESVDVIESKVQVASLRRWLSSRGVSAGFFFPVHRADPLDPLHPMHSHALAAAVLAWQAKASGEDPAAYLRKNAARLGICAADEAPDAGTLAAILKLL